MNGPNKSLEKRAQDRLRKWNSEPFFASLPVLLRELRVWFGKEQEFLSMALCILVPVESPGHQFVKVLPTNARAESGTCGPAGTPTSLEVRRRAVEKQNSGSCVRVEAVPAWFGFGDSPALLPFSRFEDDGGTKT